MTNNRVRGSFGCMVMLIASRQVYEGQVHSLVHLKAAAVAVLLNACDAAFSGSCQRTLMPSSAIIGARTYPNAVLRLLQRELIGSPSGAQVHTARAFSECIIPTDKVLERESPDAHVGRFTPDGKCLVCFSLQLQSVLLFDYLGPVPARPQTPGEQVGFTSFFKERWRLNLCSGSELLNRDFCLSLRGGGFLLFASSVPPRREGVAAAAAVVGTADGPTAAAGDAAPRPPQQQQQLLLPEDGGGEDVTAAQQYGPGSSRSASTDWCEMITFHVVDVLRCMKVDERKFPSDYFELNGNGCVSLYDNTLALTSTFTQNIHLMQVNLDGTLTDMQSIGDICQADDALPIQLAAAAEQQWWLQQQQQQQRYQQQEQMRILAAQQQAKLLNLSQIHQQQQQQVQQADVAAQGQQRLAIPQQQQLPVSQPNTLWAQAAAAAIRTIAGTNTTVGTSAAAAAAGSGPLQAAAASGLAVGSARRAAAAAAADRDEESDDMERRERRRRTPSTWQRQQLGQRGQQQAQQPAQQQAAAHGQHPGQPSADPMAALAAAGAINSRQAVAVATAAAAAAAAVLDADGQLIQGMQQRLLAFLAKRIAQQRPCEVAPSMWDLHYNFDVLSNLVIFRCRLLDKQHLLLKLGAPVNGPAAGAEMVPTRPHFFAIYDILSTHFVGMWRPTASRFLGPVVAQPAQLFPAGQDMSPWDRCGAAALYPPGYAIGLSQQQQQQGGDQQQQQRHRRGTRQDSSRARDTAAGSAAETLQDNAASALPQQQPRAEHGAAGASQTGEPAAAGSASIPGDSGTAAAAQGDSSSSNSKDAKERLKLIRQVVMLVLPGIQNLSTSPYLDPRLFRYSKHLSPIIGLRNSPTKPLQFMLTRNYDQPSRNAALPAAAGAAETCSTTAAPAATASKHPPTQQQRKQQQQQCILFQLEPAQPHTVMWGNEEVARRQLHLFHPTDPFVLTVVQTIAQPAVVSICYRA